MALENKMSLSSCLSRVEGQHHIALEIMPRSPWLASLGCTKMMDCLWTPMLQQSYCSHGRFSHAVTMMRLRLGHKIDGFYKGIAKGVL